MIISELGQHVINRHNTELNKNAQQFLLHQEQFSFNLQELQVEQGFKQNLNTYFLRASEVRANLISEDLKLEVLEAIGVEEQQPKINACKYVVYELIKSMNNFADAFMEIAQGKLT